MATPSMSPSTVQRSSNASGVRRLAAASICLRKEGHVVSSRYVAGISRSLLLTAGLLAGHPGATHGQQPDWPRLAREEQRFGIYGWVHAAMAQTEGGLPARLRLCGSFVVNTRDGGYGDVERGCLTFSGPSTDTDTTLEQWKELQHLADTSSPMTNAVGGVIRGLVGFGRPGIQATVRTANEPAATPDPYLPGDPVALVPYALAPSQLGQTPKPPHSLNFAIVERVRVDESERGEALRIEGLFSMAEDGDEISYAAPRPGFLYLAGGSGHPDWPLWSAVAGTGQVVRFYVFGTRFVRLRDQGEDPGVPDVEVAHGRRAHPTAVTATGYYPVRALRQLR
jgi:hypothetical protein